MARVFFGVVFCFLFAFVATNCPPTNELKPCYCNGANDPIIVVCKNLTEPDVIRDVFKRILDYPVNMLTIADSTLQYIPSTVVEQKDLTHIQAVRSNLVSLFDMAPTTAKKLKQIMVTQNSTIQRGIVFSHFKDLEALEELVISRTAIKKLGKAFITNMPSSIKKIVFSTTKTKQVANNVFEKLENLEILVLAHSEIKSVSRSMFSNPSKLQVMDFTYNKIETIPDDMFLDMPDLKKIYLFDNKITRLSEQVYGDTWNNKLTHLQMHNNPLVCDCAIKWFINRKEKEINLTGACDKPDGLKGKELTALTERDFNYCPK